MTNTSDPKSLDCRRCDYVGTHTCVHLGCVYDRPAKKRHSECDDCSYGKNGPCIGWCTREVIRTAGCKDSGAK